MYLSVLSLIYVPLLVRIFISTERSGCEKTKFMLIMGSIIIVLVKLLQMIRYYITNFLAYQFFCQYLSVRYAFHMILILCHQCLILVGPGVLVVKER